MMLRSSCIINYCFIIIFCGYRVCSNDLRKQNGTCYRYGRNYYLVIDKERHHFPDRYTIEVYCDKFSGSLMNMNNTLFGSTTDGEAIATLWDHHSNQRMLNLAANESFIYEHQSILPFLNPSIMYRYQEKDWIVSWRLPDQHSFRIVVVPAVNKSTFSTGLNDDSIGWLRSNAADMASVKPKFAYIDLKGEDPRLFQMKNGIIYVSYARRFKQLPEIRMAHAQLYFRGMNVSGRINVDDIVDLVIEDKVEHFHDQKNWTPFEFQNIMFYVNSIWPFQVVNITIDPYHSWVGMAYMCENVAFHNLKTHWDYGHIRGGTPALPIGNDTYLSFFHSSHTIDHLQTYCFGAFTFMAWSNATIGTTGVTHFKLTGMSRTPIVNSSMYNGPWKEQMGAFAFMDYVTFPMSFFMEEDNIFLVYGWQDKEGILSKLKLAEVLSSLDEIDYSAKQ